MKAVRHIVCGNESDLLKELKKVSPDFVFIDEETGKESIARRGKNFCLAYPITIVTKEAVVVNDEIVTPAVIEPGLHCDIMFYDGPGEEAVAEKLCAAFDKTKFTRIAVKKPKTPRHSWA